MIVVKQANFDVRQAVVGRGFKLWQLAAVLGISDSSLSRKLRMELSPTEKKRVLAAIDEVVQRFGGESNVNG